MADPLALEFELWQSPEFQQAFRYSVDRLGLNGILDAERLLHADIAQLSAQSETAGLDALGAGLLPIVLFTYIVRHLVGNYEEARQIVKEEESASGFSQGFVMGLLGWKWTNVRHLFGRWGSMRIYQMDEAMNNIRVNAYNTSLLSGYIFGILLPERIQKPYLAGLRRLAGHPSTGQWSRNEQISFVISLGAVARRFMH